MFDGEIWDSLECILRCLRAGEPLAAKEALGLRFGREVFLVFLLGVDSL